MERIATQSYVYCSPDEFTCGDPNQAFIYADNLPSKQKQGTGLEALDVESRLEVKARYL